MAGALSQSIEPCLVTLRERFGVLGQEHVLAFWEQLDSGSRARLGAQLARLDPQMDSLLRAERAAVAAMESDSSRHLEPADVIALPDRGGDPTRRSAARARGMKRVAEGRVAVFVVAGGQGTRLGFKGPKGAFPVGPVTDRCLFALHAQKIAGLSRRSGRSVPWYVMTSPSTDADTREIFDRSGCFGIPPGDVFIFQQGMVPAFDFSGRLLLAEPDRVFENPDGHGGALTALESSGALADMARRGIDTIFYFQVDNPLVKIADPEFLGLHDEAQAEMSCKVIRKTDPEAKWGVIARVDGRLAMVEYTELDDAHRHARDDRGDLRFWAGNPAIHLLEREFVARVARSASELLPFHASMKKIPCIDERGRRIDPTEPNGYKLERFVFDALPAAERVCVVETSTPEEFSPIKNASGPESPSTARRDLNELYRRWLSAAGLDLVGDGAQVEIDHSQIDGADELVAAGFGSLAEAGDLIRITTGTCV